MPQNVCWEKKKQKNFKKWPAFSFIVIAILERISVAVVEGATSGKKRKKLCVLQTKTASKTGSWCNTDACVDKLWRLTAFASLAYPWHMRLRCICIVNSHLFQLVSAICQLERNMACTHLHSFPRGTSWLHCEKWLHETKLRFH